MEPTRRRCLLSRVAGWILMVTAAVLAGRTGAETIIQFDGAANAVTTAAAPAYGLQHSFEARPGLMLQFGTPRQVWRASYLLVWNLTLDGASAFSNFADLNLAAEPSLGTMLTVGASVARGDTAFRISQPAADAGRPDLLDPNGGVLLTGTFHQTFAWEASPTLRLGQELRGSQVARPDALDQGNSTVTGLLRLDRLFQSDSVGLGIVASFASLRPLDAPTLQPHLESWTNSVFGNWNRDFDDRWNGQVTAGMQLVRTVGQEAPTLSPAASLTIRYAAGAGEASLTALHAVLPMLQTGTLSESNEVVLRGTLALDGERRRLLSGSAGFIQTRPPVVGTVEAPPSNALRGDAGLTWIFSEWLQATGRYSIAHQVLRGASSTVHVLLVGVTVRFSNAGQVPPVPSPGRRVDRSDSVGFSPEPGRP